MSRARLVAWAMGVSLVSSVACGDDEGTNEGRAGAAGDGGAAGSRAGRAGGGNAGRGMTGGAGGATGSGGTRADDGGKAGQGSGGSAFGGQGGEAGEGDFTEGGVGGGSGEGSAGASGDAGAGGSAPEPVTVLNGGRIRFYDSAGEILFAEDAPTAYALPSGGFVLSDAVLVTSVPEGATLRFPERPAPPTEARQSLTFELDAFESGATVYSQNGCSGASGTGTITLAVDESCVVDGHVDLIIQSSGATNGYIFVADIEVGDASEPPKLVPLPAWQPISNDPPKVTLSAYPDDLLALALVYARSGPGYALISGSASFVRQPDESGVATLLGSPPEAGDSWGLDAVMYEDGSTEVGNRVETRWHKRVGHPLPATSAFDATRFLPYAIDIQASLGDELEVSWSLRPGFDASGADRVAVKLNEQLELWLPPSSNEVRIPASFVFFSSVERVEVELEDQDAVEGYADALANFGWAAPLWSDSTANPERRISHGLWLSE